MRIFWAAAAAAIFVCGAARAERPDQSPTNGEAAVGVGVPAALLRSLMFTTERLTP
jgi:hypothetical protein